MHKTHTQKTLPNPLEMWKNIAERNMMRRAAALISIVPSNKDSRVFCCILFRQRQEVKTDSVDAEEPAAQAADVYTICESLFKGFREQI